MITRDDIQELLQDLKDEIILLGLNEKEAEKAVDKSYIKANLTRGGDYAVWVFHRSFNSLVDEIIFTTIKAEVPTCSAHFLNPSELY